MEVVDDKRKRGVSLSECAEIYGKSPETIKRWCYSGKLKYRKEPGDGKHWTIFPDDDIPSERIEDKIDMLIEIGLAICTHLGIRIRGEIIEEFPYIRRNRHNM